MIKIQLLGQNAGFLDVLEDSIVALTISVADIKDISKRTGSFSKTITLPATKNNNRLLNDYFEVNVLDGTFSINKVQRCLLLDDNVSIFDNMVLQLMHVKKEQNTNMEDDIVEYEVSIKDTTADFFTIVNNRYLSDLDFSEFGHTFSAQEIVDSFSHSWVDGYKYVVQYGDDFIYPITELKPAIYAKQYWTKIHADAGFSYVWNEELSNNIRFDKLLIPYSSGVVKVSEDSLAKSRVIATGPSGQTFISPTTTVQSPYLWRGGDRSLAIANTIIVDPLGAYNIANSRYTSPFYLMQPNTYEYILEFDYEIVVDNVQATSGTILTSTAQNYGQINVIASVRNRRTLSLDTAFCNQAPTLSIQGSTFAPGETIIFNGRSRTTIYSTNHQLGDELDVMIGLQHAADYNSPLRSTRIIDFKVRLTSEIKVTIQLNSNQVYNTWVDLNSYLPTQIKQNDFIKSIMMMYNLFVEVDSVDPNKLIYTTRDEFYDTGLLLDWTAKLARDREQTISFLPWLSSKSTIFTYKNDSDPANEAYFNQLNEVYGQHQVIYSNNYVKGLETKELIFSPTPFQLTSWFSYLPLLPSGDQKYNIRILLDNGVYESQRWFLLNWIDPNVTTFPPGPTSGNYLELTNYPFVSHLDRPTNPTYDINYGVCDFYFTEIQNVTNNNLFNNFWRRTCAQINSGRLLTAYFNLKGSDIARLRLNAKIRIDNSYWNINKIIDFDANKQELTKVELISLDEETNLPSFGQDSQFFPPYLIPPTFDPVFVGNNDTISKAVTQRYNELNHINRTTNNSNNGVISLGSFNRIDGGVKGVLIGDFIHASQSGLYIGQNTFIGGNLGNVGGLPSTLAVDNNTGGNNIIVSTGDVIEGEPGAGLDLRSDSMVSLSFLDPTATIYSNIQAGFAGNSEFLVETAQVGSFRTFMAGGSGFTEIVHTDGTSPVVYGNSVRLNNNTSAGVVIESNDLVTADIGSIQVTPTNIIITNPTLLVLNSPLINIPNLPPYADDAAAGAGGLNAGDLYQTDGTGALTTAGIVMIKQ